MKVTICLIATNKYKQFVKTLVQSIDKFFLLNHDVSVVLFTDEITNYRGCGRIGVEQELIKSFGFPEATLYRYSIMTSRNYECDYLFYMDVDMLVVDRVGEEILSIAEEGITAVRHPGFFCNGGGSWGDNRASTSYTYPSKRRYYYAGGFQGGEMEKYYRLMQRLERDIDEDDKNGVVAEWHDETHWNRALSEMKGNFTELNPAYCMVEQQILREKWGIDNISPKIIALAKNHEEIRS